MHRVIRQESAYGVFYISKFQYSQLKVVERKTLFVIEANELARECRIHF